MKIAFLFAGQGAQYVGQGKDFYDHLDFAKEIYDSYPEIRDLCFYDKDNTLNQTINTQKAILLTVPKWGAEGNVLIIPPFVPQHLRHKGWRNG